MKVANRIFRLNIVKVMAMMMAFLPQPVLAVTLQDCSKEAENVRETGSNFRSDDFDPKNFFNNFQNHLDAINAVTEKDIVLLNMSNIVAEEPQDAFDEAIAMLRLCAWRTRLTELGGVDEGDEAKEADATSERVEQADNDLSSPPIALESPGSWFTAEDYPPAAMQDGREGTVSYDLTIEADGKVLGCQATGPAGGSDLESATCDAIMARGHFKPATDSTGRPVRGELSGTISWTL